MSVDIIRLGAMQMRPGRTIYPLTFAFVPLVAIFVDAEVDLFYNSVDALLEKMRPT